LKVIREELSQPVVGIMEASLYAARTPGGRFNILSTSQRTRYKLEDSVKHYGLQEFCAGVHGSNLSVLELESKPEVEVLAMMCDVGKRIVEDGADVINLECAGMTNMKAIVGRVAGDEVQVVDGVLAGVQHLAGLCRIGAKATKRGMYANAADDRWSRGQDWL
jgi:Asp/Glu/hydantoin racemase